MSSNKAAFLSLLLTVVTSFKTEEIGFWFGCPGKLVPMKSCQAHSILLVSSVTVYSSDNETALAMLDDTRCHLVPDSINRTIHSKDDQGLSEGYDYLYRLIMHHCQGLRTCQVFRLPEWSAIAGHFLADGATENSQRHFSGALIDAECHTEGIARWPAPPSTTTTTTEPTTTGFAVYFHIYQTRLYPAERVALAVLIALSLVVILVLLLLLYNWDRYRRKLWIATVFDKLGKPHEEHDWFQEELYRETEADLYSSAKPDEIVTLDRRTLRGAKLWVEEDNLSQHSHNSCSTMGCRRKKGYDNKSFTHFADVNKLHVPLTAVPSNTITPPNYDTVENLELERRMAETLVPTDSQDDSEESSLSSPSNSVDGTGADNKSELFIIGKKIDYDIGTSCPTLEKIHTEHYRTCSTIWRVEAKFKDIGTHSLPQDIHRHVVQPFSYKCEVKVINEIPIEADVQKY